MPFINNCKAISFMVGTFSSVLPLSLRYLDDSMCKDSPADNTTLSADNTHSDSNNMLNASVALLTMTALFCIAWYSYLKNQGVKNDIDLLRDEQGGDIYSSNIPALRELINAELVRLGRSLQWAQRKEYITEEQSEDRVPVLEKKLRFLHEYYSHSAFRHNTLIVLLYSTVTVSVWNTVFCSIGIGGFFIPLAFGTLLPISHIMLASAYRVHYNELVKFYHKFLDKGVVAIGLAGQERINELNERITALEAEIAIHTKTIDEKNSTIAVLEQTVVGHAASIQERDSTIQKLERKLGIQASSLAVLNTEKQVNQEKHENKRRLGKLERFCGEIALQPRQATGSISAFFRVKSNVDIEGLAETAKPEMRML